MIDILTNDIQQVIAIKVPGGVRDLKDYYKYEAVMRDGSTIDLRDRATRLYANAFLTPFGTNPGRTRAAQHLCYGKKPPSHVTVVKTFPVTLAN